jgi:hypothetical protein
MPFGRFNAATPRSKVLSPLRYESGKAERNALRAFE